MSLEPGLVLDFLQKAGVLGMLILIVFGGARRASSGRHPFWVYGWYADELLTRAEHAENQRDRAIATADKAVHVSEQVT